MSDYWCREFAVKGRLGRSRAAVEPALKMPISARYRAETLQRNCRRAALISQFLIGLAVTNAALFRCWWFAEAHTGTAAILRNEFDARGF